MIRPQTGFTLIEVMLATAVFSFVLLIISQGMLAVVRQQQTSQVTLAAQQNARTAVEQIAREARGASDVITGFEHLCLKTPGGWVKYYAKFWESSPIHIYRTTLVTELECAVVWDRGEPITSDNVSTFYLEATTTAALPPALTITVDATQPDMNLLRQKDPSDYTKGWECDPTKSKSFCNVARQSTTVNLGGTP